MPGAIFLLVAFFTGPLLAQDRRDSIDIDTMTASEVATVLANPVAPIGRVTVQFKRWSFERDITEGMRTSGYSVVLESSVPFRVGNQGATIRFRPNIPVNYRYPVAGSNATATRSGLGDITFDLAYGKRNGAGLLFAFGLAGTLPTATLEEFGSGRLSLGPEVLVVFEFDWGVFGVFPTHEWRVSGPGPFSKTTIQPLMTFTPGRDGVCPPGQALPTTGSTRRGRYR